MFLEREQKIKEIVTEIRLIIHFYKSEVSSEGCVCVVLCRGDSCIQEKNIIPVTTRVVETELTS